MVDEAIVAAPAPTPVVEAAPIAPIVEAAPVVETPAPIVEAAPVIEPIVEAPKPLLSPEEKKPVDGEVKSGDVKVEPEVVVSPIYEFSLPEEATKDNPVFQAFTEKLGQFQTLHNVGHDDVQKFGQEMIDIQIQNVKDIMESQNKSSWDWFNNRNKEWLENAKKDSKIGGENWDQTVNSAQQAISLYGGTKAEQIETAKLLQETGVENHPAILRFLANITRTAAKEGSPVSSQSTPIQKTGIAQAMYGKTSGAAA